MGLERSVDDLLPRVSKILEDACALLLCTTCLSTFSHRSSSSMLEEASPFDKSIEALSIAALALIGSLFTISITNLICSFRRSKKPYLRFLRRPATFYSSFYIANKTIELAIAVFLCQKGGNDTIKYALRGLYSFFNSLNEVIGPLQNA